MMKFIKSTWELPQNSIGLAIKKIFKAEKYTTYKTANVYSWRFKGGLSLGKYIFVPVKLTDEITDEVLRYIKHEYGHTLQSKLLGWFFLLVIGLPSLIWAGCFKGYRNKTGRSYYDFYTERWANRLGGVDL